MNNNAKVKAIVLTGYGSNCEMEMAHACRLAGAGRVDIVHASDLFAGDVRLDDYHFLNLPGGFLDGDDLGAGQAAAHRFNHAVVAATGLPLREQFDRFIACGKLILGVCNGFQLLVKMGLLPALAGNYAERAASLTHNASGRFEDRWVTLVANPASACVFTRGMDRLCLPVRHGEGRFVARDTQTMDAILAANLVALQYADPASGAATASYPANPNGSPHAIAGVCDKSGRVFGLMPHPEAFLHRTNHPRWTREELPETGQGLLFFENAVRYVAANLL